MGEVEVNSPCLREELVQRLLDEIKQFNPAQHPSNTLLYGCFASGKTSAVKRLIRRVNQETSVKVVYANCWKYYTRMSVYTLIARALGLAIPRRGLATDEVLDQISQRLEQGQEKLLVVLDSVDGLLFNHGQQLLYELVRLSRQTRCLSIIVVCDDERGFAELDGRIRSTLCLRDAFIPPFSKPELMTILEDRAENTLVPGAASRAELEVCANNALAAKSARVGLELLWHSAMRAEQRGRIKITANDLDGASVGFPLPNRLVPLTREEELIVGLLS